MTVNPVIVVRVLDANGNQLYYGEKSSKRERIEIPANVYGQARWAVYYDENGNIYQEGPVTPVIVL